MGYLELERPDIERLEPECFGTGCFELERHQSEYLRAECCGLEDPEHEQL